MADNQKKIRVEMRKNRGKTPRNKLWEIDPSAMDSGHSSVNPGADQRVRPKGDLSRKRTVKVQESDQGIMPDIDRSTCLPGRVLRVHGLLSVVEVESGQTFRCTVRRLLKTLATDERSLVTCGDRVWIRPEIGLADIHQSLGRAPSGRSPLPAKASAEATIERVEPRTCQLTRSSRQRLHTIVANVDQVVFVLSMKEPDLKLHLIDRYLASAIQGGVTPVLCLNKADLVEASEYQNVIGLYSRLGYRTFMTSASEGLGIGPLRDLLKNRQTVFSGQSGVGKSSLLNAIQPDLSLRVREVSEVNNKGKHTTTTAELIRLSFGGWVVDTPGIRQFELCRIQPEEVTVFFPEFHPFLAQCRFSGCTHLHESGCAVMGAVVRRQIAESRYTSYKGILGPGPSKSDD